MEKITGDQVEKAIKDAGIVSWVLRSCSICGTPLEYTFHDNHVEYHSACNCTTFYAPPQVHGYDNISDLLNMQTPEVRQRMWNSIFGSSHLPQSSVE